MSFLVFGNFCTFQIIIHCSFLNLRWHHFRSCFVVLATVLLFLENLLPPFSFFFLGHPFADSR